MPTRYADRMLIGRIRPIETRSLSVEAASIAEARAEIEAQVPEGWALTDAEATMAKASVMITVNATMARRDGVRDLQASDYAALKAAVPDGWQLLSVRAE